MSAYIDRLQDEYRRAAKVGADLMEAAATDNRELNAEEAEQRDKAFDDVTRLKGEIDKALNFETLREAGDAFRSAAAPVVERARQERREPTETELFRTLLRSGGEREFRMSDRVALAKEDPSITLRALGVGSDTVETSFADFVTVYERTMTPMLRPDVVRVINRPDGAGLILPRVTADPAPGGTLTAQAGGITELDATFSSVTLNPYKYALTNLWSKELADDNSIQIEDFIAQTTGRALGLNIGSALTLADGSSKPQGFAADGLVSGTTTAAGTANNTFFGPADIVDIFYALAAPYRAVASWQVSSTAFAKVRKLQDSTGQLIWQPSLIPGAPETLLGRPIYENPHLAAVASAARPLYVGDFQRYVVAKTATRVESSIHYKFNTDQLALRTVERVDGDLIDVIAVRALVCANA